MMKGHTAQITALAITLVFISCALFVIPISSDAGSDSIPYSESTVSGKSGMTGIEADTETNTTKTGTVSNALASMIVYLNMTTTAKYTALDQTLDVNTDTTITSPSVLKNGSKVIFSNDATLIVDGCALCIDGNVSFLGNVSISLVNGASLYLGNIGIIKSENNEAFSIEGPSFDLEYKVNNDIAYNNEKNAYFHFSINIKENAPIKIAMGDYVENYGFEMVIGYNPDGKEWDVTMDFSFGDFVEFIGKKYSGTEEDIGHFTFEDFVNFILESENRIPTADIKVFVYDIKANLNLMSTDDDNNPKNITKGSVQINKLDLKLTTNGKGGNDYKLYAVADCDYILIDIEEREYHQNIISTPSSINDIYLESIDFALKITSDEMTKIYANANLFTFGSEKKNDDGSSRNIEVNFSETELNLKITSSGAIGFINMFKSMFEAPNRISKILTSTDISTLMKDSAMSLDTKLLHISYKIKDADLDENKVIFNMTDASMECILPSNNVRFCAESLDVLIVWQSYSYSDDGKKFYTEINSTESCKDIDLYIDAKDTTPNELVKLVVELLELDVKQDTIDSIMDYKKKINMVVDVNIGSNVLESDTTTRLCTPLDSTIVHREASSFKLENSKIEVKIDTSGNNSILMYTDVFELSSISGDIGKNPKYTNEYAEANTYVQIYGFNFSTYASYGHMYKLLTGVYLYMLDEEHSLTVSSVQQIFVNFLIQDTSKTKLNLDLKYAEIGTRIDTKVGTNTINTTKNIVSIGDRYSKTQDVSVEILINIEYINKTLHLRDSHVQATAKNDALIVTKITNTDGGLEKSITAKDSKLNLSLKTEKEGIPADKIETAMDAALKKIIIEGTLVWGSFTSNTEWVDETSGNTYSEEVCCINNVMGIDTILGTMSATIRGFVFDSNAIINTRDIISSYSEDSIIVSIEITDIHGKILSWERFTFTGITVTFSEDDYYENAEQVNADINWNDKYDMYYTDGGTYFKNIFRLNSGYTISNGIDTIDESEGRMIYVDSFSTTESSDICGGIVNAAVGTKIALTKPTNLTDKGYTFAGWMIGDEIFVKASEEDVTYYAPPKGEFTIKYAYGYVLTADTNGGTPVDEICAHEEDYIDVSKLITSREGYTFAGWDCKELISADHDRMPASDATIYAKWIPNVYNISFDANGGSVNSNLLTSARYTFDTEYILPNASSLNAPYKEGYTMSFLGWYASDDSSKTIVTTIKNVKAGDLVYIASWKETPNAYDITIDANGGSLNITKITAHTDEKIDVSSVTGTMNGYVLSSLQGYTDGMTMPAHSITLKAIWAKIITYDLIEEGTDKIAVNTDSEAVKLSKDDVESLVEKSQNKDIEINFSDILVNLSSESMMRLSQDIYGNYSEMKMSVVRSTVSDINIDTGKVSLIKEIISINVNSKGVSDNLGSVSVSIPLDKDLEGTTYKVYYLDSESNLTEMKTVCTVVNGITIVTFTTDHFSDYVIMADEQPSGQDSNISMFVIIGIAIAALAIIGIVVYARKVKQ